jgi:hypothetical protein
MLLWDYSAVDEFLRMGRVFGGDCPDAVSGKEHAGLEALKNHAAGATGQPPVPWISPKSQWLVLIAVVDVPFAKHDSPAQRSAEYVRLQGIETAKVDCLIEFNVVDDKKEPSGSPFIDNEGSGVVDQDVVAKNRSAEIPNDLGVEPVEIEEAIQRLDIIGHLVPLRRKRNDPTHSYYSPWIIARSRFAGILIRRGPRRNDGNVPSFTIS